MRARRAPTVANLAPDSRGVITYATYQVAVARDGDTLGERREPGRHHDRGARAAQRPARGLPCCARARCCSCPTAWRGRPGRRAGADTVTTPAARRPGQRPRRPAAPADNPFQNGQTEPLIDPVRHRVEAGETAYSIARLYGVSVTALASWNGLGPDLAVRENQELLIPIVGDANRISTGLDDTQPGQGTPVAAPPSAAAPLPAGHHRRGRRRSRRTSARCARRRAGG